jgi:16S rRNA (guanine527-N7)-methyltransferase
MDEILKYFPHITQKQLQLLQTYHDRLLWWNERINLISRQDTAHVAERHLLHALAIAKCFPFPKDTRILDLGTGGGLPGIPLAIMFPDCRFTLIDGTGKKIKAVQSIIEELELKNVTAVHSRAEDFHGEFDIVVTRAVATLKNLWEWAAPLLKGEISVFGHAAKSSPMQRLKSLGVFGEGVQWSKGLIALKGGDLKTEIAEVGKIHKPGVHLISIQDFFSEPYFEAKCLVFIPVS